MRMMGRSVKYFLGLALIVVMSGFSEVAMATSGTEVNSETSFTVDLNYSSAMVNVTPYNDSGNFAASDTQGSARFSVSTNNYTGYSLSIVAGNDNGRLINEDLAESKTYHIDSITSKLSKSEFNNVANNNRWGYAPSKYYDAVNEVVVENNTADPVFLPAPTTEPTLLDRTAAPNALSNNYSIALGVRVDKTMHAGSYVGEFDLVVVANPMLYTINYDKNTDNEDDEVLNMPATQSGSIVETSVVLSGLIPERESYVFLGWCSVQPTEGAGGDLCAGTIYNPDGGGTNLAYGIDFTTENNATLYAMWRADKFVCTKQYRLQNADGTWGDYIADGTEEVASGDVCTYQKGMQWYTYDEGAPANRSVTVTSEPMSGDVTVSASLYRNKYTLTVEAGPNTYDATGSGSYRWGETVNVGVTKNADLACQGFNTPTWTASYGTAPADGESSTFVMPTASATVTGTADFYNKTFAISLVKGSGATGIKINGTTYTGSSVSLTCGNHTAEAVLDTETLFVSWSGSDGVQSITDSAATSTQFTVAGSTGTLTLNTRAKYMQSLTTSSCPTTRSVVYDKRDGKEYYVQKLTLGGTAKCWMTSDLHLASGTLTSTLSNVTSSYTLPTSTATPKTSGFDAPNFSTVGLADATGFNCNDNLSRCTVYYSYAVATAGTNPSSGEAASDICPKGWRLPTKAEYDAVASTYHYTNAAYGAPMYFGAVGYIYNDSLTRNDLNYWSSTAGSASMAYMFDGGNLQVNNTGNYGSTTTSSYNKTLGVPVRCVTK